MSLFCALLLLVQAITVAAYTQDIYDYVKKDDGAFKWEYMGPDTDIHGRNLMGDKTWTGYLLNVTSQRWLTDADFSEDSEMKSLWWHYMVVIVPSEIKYTKNSTIWITGWSNGSGAPTAKDEDIALAAALAMGTGTVTGALFQIPCEHIKFATDPIQKSRGEDAIIAFTWDHYLKDPSNSEWLVRFPMVKGSMKAMDAMTEFMATAHPQLGVTCESFIVSGASKRGWTTWLLGAVDKPRVQAIVPIVLDAINFAAVEHHQYQSYNGWSWALKDYIEMDIMSRIDDPNMLLLQQQEDPYFFKEELTMPKLIVNAVMDEFQQPDDTNYWWRDMPEPKHFLMTPNAEHSEATGIFEIVPAIGTWAAYLLKETTVPTWDWNIDETTGEIVATLDDNGEVHEASMWYAYSCGKDANGIQMRDFRIMSLEDPCTCGIQSDEYCANLKSGWTRVVLDAEVVDGKRTYRANMAAPDDGRYVAFMIDVKYAETDDIHSWTPFFDRDHHGNKKIPVDKPGRLEFTTQVSVMPNSFPYADCTGTACGSTMV